MAHPSPPDYYSVLGLKPDATREEFERAYNRLAGTYQPDAAKPPLDRERMAAVNEAFDVLDDPARRAEYDQGRAARRAEPPGGTPGFRRNRYGLALAVAGFGLIAAAGIAVAIAVSTDNHDAPPLIAGPTLEITSPANGATVQSPVALSVESGGIEIAPPEAGIAGAAHYHVFVDVHPFTAAGERIPEGERIYHFSSESVEIDLPPGTHGIIVALGDNSEIRLEDTPVDAIEIIVE